MTALALAGQYTDALLRAAIALRSESATVDWATLLGRLPSFDDADVRRSVAEATEHEISDLRDALHKALEGTDPLARVVQRSHLDADAAEILAVVCALEINENRQAVVAALRGQTDGWRPTFGLLRAILPEDVSLDGLGPRGCLRRAALVADSPDSTWARADVIVDPAVSWFLVDGTDEPRCPEGLELLDTEESEDGASLVLVAGHDVSRRRQVATQVAAGCRFVIAPTTPVDTAAWERLVRHASLSGRSILVELVDDLPAVGRAVVDRADHVVWALSSRAEVPVSDAPSRPWHEVRADSREATAGELLNAFGPDAGIEHRLSANQVALATRVLSGRIKADNETPSQSVTAAVRRLASGELDRLATRIRPRRTWNDLVLPPDQLLQVRDVVSRYRHRTQVFDTWGFKPIPSAGVVAMFAGPPGTGKTLSAEIVAGELGLDLFRIDLATLVSKYIGETEKNLEKIFQAADGGTMVLLFDEADAVFGKRSEVKDANDKYANVETSYLLQRIESYDGVVVLTTNYVANIDEAFIRRIHVSVDFQLPDEAERLQIWANAFPAAAPLGDLDLPFLARQFRLSGASIRSISLGAAFRAADDETSIGMDAVLTSLRVELRKQGRLTSSIDFGKYAHLGALRAASVPAPR